MDEQTREQGQQEHPATLPAQVSHSPFERAVLAALSGPFNSEATIVALFDGRVSYSTVRGWMRGRWNPPLWAWRCLGVRFRERAARDLEFLALTENPPAVAPGQGSHRNICKWNQRRYAAKSGGPAT